MSTFAEDLKKVLPAMDPSTGDFLLVIDTPAEYLQALRPYAARYPYIGAYHPAEDASQPPQQDLDRFVRDLWVGDVCAYERVTNEGAPLGLLLLRRDDPTTCEFAFFTGQRPSSPLIRIACYRAGIRTIYHHSPYTRHLPRTLGRQWDRTHQREGGRERFVLTMTAEPSAEPLLTRDPE